MEDYTILKDEQKLFSKYHPLDVFNSFTFMEYFCLYADMYKDATQSIIDGDSAWFNTSRIDLAGEIHSGS